MKASKDSKKVEKMFAEGEVNAVDPETKYRYSLVAHCPKDGSLAYVERYARSGHSLSSVTFKCSTCYTEFEVPKSQMMVV